VRTQRKHAPINVKPTVLEAKKNIAPTANPLGTKPKTPRTSNARLEADVCREGFDSRTRTYADNAGAANAKAWRAKVRDVAFLSMGMASNASSDPMLIAKKAITIVFAP